VGIEARDGYRLWIDGPVAPGAAATTIGRTILIRREHVGNERLVRHERVHVAQYQRHGLVGFFARYLPPYVHARLLGWPHWAAYRRIPFEVEAEWRARRSFLGSTADIPVVGS